MTKHQKNPAAPPLNRRDAIGRIVGTGLGIASLSLTERLGFSASRPQRATPVAGKYITIDGNKVYYKERGQGIPVVVTPGGQNPLETVRPLAEKLATKYRVITWDRANLGHADVVFKGARDLDLWSDQLAELLTRLNASPAYLVGASSGSRTSYVTALRYPEVVRGVFLFLVTGGGTIGEALGRRYYGVYADMAEKEGMAAVAKAPYWAERIESNPDNRDRLLSMDPHEFARVMRRWQHAMRSNPDPVLGVKADDLRQIAANGTPMAIIQGCADQPQHRRDRSELFAQLTNATLIPTPEGYCEEGETGPASFNKLMAHPEVPEVKEFRAYEWVSAAPPLIEDFITKTEAKRKK